MFAKIIACNLCCFITYVFLCSSLCVCFVLWRSDCSWQQTAIMAHLPHMLNISVRPHHPEPWRWHHDWEAHRHSYSGVVTLRLMRAHPGPGGWIPVMMQTVLTLDRAEVTLSLDPLHLHLLKRRRI